MGEFGVRRQAVGLSPLVGEVVVDERKHAQASAPGVGLRVWGLGSRVYGSGLRVWGLWCRV